MATYQSLGQRDEFMALGRAYHRVHSQAIDRQIHGPYRLEYVDHRVDLLGAIRSGA